MIDKRREIIIDYINKHPGCTIQDVAEGVKNPISRKPVFRIVYDLIKEGAILDERDKNVQGKKNHKLIVNTTSLLVSVPKELDEFKSDYLAFVKDVMQKIKTRDKDDEDVCNLLAGVIDKFHILINIYLFHSTLTWSRTIRDAGTLNKLNTTMLTKLAEIQSDLSQILKPSLGVFQTYDMLSGISGDRIIKYNPIFRKFGIVNEANQVTHKIGLKNLYGNLER